MIDNCGQGSHILFGLSLSDHNMDNPSHANSSTNRWWEVASTITAFWVKYGNGIHILCCGIHCTYAFLTCLSSTWKNQPTTAPLNLGSFFLHIHPTRPASSVWPERQQMPGHVRVIVSSGSGNLKLQCHPSSDYFDRKKRTTQDISPIFPVFLLMEQNPIPVDS